MREQLEHRDAAKSAGQRSHDGQDSLLAGHSVPNQLAELIVAVVGYNCETGYTLDGKFDGEIHWSVEYQANGKTTEPKTCQAVQCGSPVAITHAHVDTSSLVFQQAAKYTCDEGYTVTGSYAGSQEFIVSCESDGRTADASECLPASCGVAPSAPNAQTSRNEKFFGDEVKYYCKHGYTTTGQVDGATGFTAHCSADGEFEGVGAWPQATSAADATRVTEVFYGGRAEWQCKEGYSVDGTSLGSTSFEKQCQASGDFGTSAPHDCEDVDLCVGDPCTANGVCKDLGAGVVNPGYACECYDGFKLSEDADGKPTCSEDHCHGDPCGRGGTCTDYSAPMPVTARTAPDTSKRSWVSPHVSA